MIPLRFWGAATIAWTFSIAPAQCAQPAMGSQAAAESSDRAAEKVAAPSMRVEGAWIREAPPTAEVMAAYFVLRNVGNRPDRLLSVETPISKLPTFHRTRMHQGMARMEEQDSITVPPRAVVRLRPGGDHLMLFDLSRLPRQGETVPMTFRFERAGAIQVEVPVRSARE